VAALKRDHIDEESIVSETRFEALEYLQKLGHITPGMEDLELAELQGAEGLRALRVTVDLSHPGHETPLAAELAAGNPPASRR
jgi:hypothetical protein